MCYYKNIKMLALIHKRGVKMSESHIINTERKFGHTENSFPIMINQTIAKKIDSIAAKRQTDTEILVNEILERYIIAHSHSKKQNGADFLLSLAGMFDSEENNASENVSNIVSDFILNQQRGKRS